MEVIKNTQFMIKALGKDETKEVLNGVCVTKKYMYITDGFRMHLEDNYKELKEGFYKIVSIDKANIVLELDENNTNYPRLDTVYDENQEKENPLTFKICRKVSSATISILMYKLIKQKDILVDYQFLKDISQLNGEVSFYVVGDKKLIAEYADKKALIMSIETPGN